MVNAKKILIVDDDVDILEALQLTFESAGYETKASTKGDEVYTILDKFNADVIVLDVLLSGKDGRIICKNLKSDSKTKNLPVIMISAHPDAAKSTKAVGADDFLAKPFDINEIIEKVERHI